MEFGDAKPGAGYRGTHGIRRGAAEPSLLGESIKEERNSMYKPDAIERYLTDFKRFERNLNGESKTAFHKIRQSAISRFRELGFPTRKMEAWKYTDISQIAEQNFPLETEVRTVSHKQIRPFSFAKAGVAEMVFVNGRYSQALSSRDAFSGEILLLNLPAALIEKPETVNRYIGKFASMEQDSFVALNTAFSADGLVLIIPDNTRVAKPVHLLNIAIPDEAPYQSHPRVLVVVGKNSEVNFIESYRYLSEDAYFHNMVTEIVAGENSAIQHMKLQDENRQAFHISTCQVQQASGSTFKTVNIDLGGALVRNNLNIRLNGENCTAELSGFYLASGTQHIDNHTFVDHAMPHSQSNQLYKGILSDRASGVFSGTIYVRPDAQKTSAFQSNKNLLLSDSAEINSKPQLKIYADDVKCTHGATIGELDEQALFYLRQRGIDKEHAKTLLQFAFAAEIFEKISFPRVKEIARQVVQEYLSKM